MKLYCRATSIKKDKNKKCHKKVDAVIDSCNMTINRNVIEAGMALDISTMEVTQSRTLADAKYTLSKDEQQILLLIVVELNRK